MEVEFGLTPQEFQAFSRHAYNKPVARKRWPEKKRLFFAIFALLTGVIVFTSHDKPGFEKFLDLAFPGVLGMGLGMSVLALLLGLRNRLTFQTTQDYLDDPRNQWLFDPMRITISPDGCSTESRVRRAFDSWSIVYEIEATADYAFFWTSTTGGQIIPARAFRDRQEFEDFVALARRYHQSLHARKSEAITSAPPVPSQDIFRRDSP
jgi:hypothetical protein